MKKAVKKGKVAVLMSGGVDSSVSAWLLKNQGFEVEGFFIKFWTDMKCGVKKENSCCNDESLRDAKSVAKKVGIPLHIVGARQIFKKVIVDYFIDEYGRLRTPNPCVKCNRRIKFGWFLEVAKKCGFEKVASGHYAQIKKDKDGTAHLLSGKDKNKDQSYFLHHLRQDQLARIIFPVGNLRKDEVREIARKNNLPVSEKKESQEVCFVAGDYRQFLKNYLQSKFFKSGNIVDSEGKIIGRHEGLVNYTIGQRKGLGNINLKNDNRKPMFVLGFGKKKNELIVGPEKSLYQKEVIVKNINWTSEKAEKLALAGKNIKAKIRYRGEAASCKIMIFGNKLKIIFQKPQRAVTPGQSAVFYCKNEVLGGGVIM